MGVRELSAEDKQRVADTLHETLERLDREAFRVCAQCHVEFASLPPEQGGLRVLPCMHCVCASCAAAAVAQLRCVVCDERLHGDAQYADAVVAGAVSARLEPGVERRCALPGGGDDAALHRCVTCSVDLCVHCSLAHQHHAQTREHVLEAVPGSAAALSLCADHDGQPIVAVCRPCAKLLCPMCLMGRHGGHKAEPIGRATPSLKDMVRVQGQVMDEIMPVLLKIAAAEPRDAAHLEAHGARVREQIDAKLDSVVQQLRDKAAEISAHTAVLTATAEKDARDSLKACNELEGELRTIVQRINSAVKKCQEAVAGAEVMLAGGPVDAGVSFSVLRKLLVVDKRLLQLVTKPLPSPLQSLPSPRLVVGEWHIGLLTLDVPKAFYIRTFTRVLHAAPAPDQVLAYFKPRTEERLHGKPLARNLGRERARSGGNGDPGNSDEDGKDTPEAPAVAFTFAFSPAAQPQAPAASSAPPQMVPFAYVPALPDHAEECSVCGDLPQTAPLLLPCLHVVCTDCMSDIREQSREKNTDTTCCVCHERFTDAQPMVDFVSVHDTTAPCMACATSLSEHRCIACGQALCDACAREHVAGTAAHALESIRAPAAPEDTPVLFCEVCRVLTHHAASHAAHSLLALPDALARLRQSCKLSITFTQTALSQAERMLETLARERARILSDLDTVRSTITHSISGVLDGILNRADELVQHKATLYATTRSYLNNASSAYLSRLGRVRRLEGILQMLRAIGRAETHTAFAVSPLLSVLAYQQASMAISQHHSDHQPALPQFVFRPPDNIIDCHVFFVGGVE